MCEKHGKHKGMWRGMIKTEMTSQVGFHHPSAFHLSTLWFGSLLLVTSWKNYTCCKSRRLNNEWIMTPIAFGQTVSRNRTNMYTYQRFEFGQSEKTSDVLPRMMCIAGNAVRRPVWTLVLGLICSLLQQHERFRKNTISKFLGELPIYPTRV